MSTLKDLNKHLFDQLERLAKADKEGLETEVERIQDLLAEGASSDSEEVQLLLEGMVAKEGEWKEKSKRVAVEAQ